MKNMESIIKNLEMEINNLKKDIEILVDGIDIESNNCLAEEMTLFELSIKLDEKETLYKKLKNFKIVAINKGEYINHVVVKDKKGIEYTITYFKNTNGLSIHYYMKNRYIGIEKYITGFICNTKNVITDKWKTYRNIGKDKQNLYSTLCNLYNLIGDTF